MKIINLKFAYFQSYNQEIEIDFTQFNDILFLITGNTGSGKTSIFDAICYGLFGKLSNEDRKLDAIKSSYATDCDLCYVELTIMVKGQEYIIYRQPKQTLIVKNKQKVVPSSVSLSQFNSVKVQDIDKRIIELIGMDINQFRQIILLPQGNFQKLLKASSKEKEEIFRKLFKTEIYTNLTDEIGKRLKNENKALDNNNIKINTLISDDLKNLPTNELLPVLNNCILEQTSNLKIQEKLINDKEQLLKSLERKVEINKNLITIQQQLTTINNYNFKEKELLIDNYNRYYKHVNPLIIEKNTTLHELQNEENLTNNNLANIDALNKQKANISIMINQYQNDLQNSTDKQNLLKSLTLQEQNYQEYENLKSNLTNLYKAINDIVIIDTQALLDKKILLQQKLADYQKNKAQYDDKQAKLSILLTQKQSLIPLAIINEYHQNTTKLHEISDNIHQLDTELKVLKQELLQLKYHYHQSIAFQLAKELQVNTPCPVCGSVDHPHKITNNQEFKDINLMNTLENNYSNKNNELNKLLSEQHHLVNYLNQYTDEKIIEDQHKHQLINEDIILIQQFLNNNRTIDNDIQELTTIIYSIDQEIKESDLKNVNQINKQNYLQEEIAKTTKKINDLGIEFSLATIQQKILEIEKYFSNLNNNIDINEKALINIDSKITMIVSDNKRLAMQIQNRKNDIEQLNKSINELIEKYQLTSPLDTKEYDNLKKEIDLKSSQLQQLIGQKNSYETELKAYQYIDGDVNIIRTELTNIKKNKDELFNNIKNNEEVYEKIKHIINDNHTIRLKIEQYQELFNTLNGSKQNGDISFERYILSYYFNQILILANENLRKISNNRYVLKLSSYVKGNAKKGLDLAIIDAYNGDERDINTLSGGETFQASLALALGLSDYISQKSHINNVEFLFIDEGFGTLDSESLDIAITTLNNLTLQGKSIGIISHVEELKKIITRKIMIEKAQNGSTLKY